MKQASARPRPQPGEFNHRHTGVRLRTTVADRQPEGKLGAIASRSDRTGGSFGDDAIVTL